MVMRFSYCTSNETVSCLMVTDTAIGLHRRFCIFLKLLIIRCISVVDAKDLQESIKIKKAKINKSENFTNIYKQISSRVKSNLLFFYSLFKN